MASEYALRTPRRFLRGVLAARPPVARDQRRAVAAVAVLGSAVIHAVQVPPHLGEWAPAGIFFACIALVQAVLVAALLVRGGRSSATATLVVSLLVLAIWALSRSVGLPFGPEGGLQEPVGTADLIASGLEVFAAGCLVRSLFFASSFATRPQMGRAHRVAAVSLTTAAVTVLTVLAVQTATSCSHSVGPAEERAVRPSALELLQHHEDHDPYRLQLGREPTAEGHPAASSHSHC